MNRPVEVSHVAEVFARATNEGPHVPVIGALMLLNEVVIPRKMTVTELAVTVFEPDTADYKFVAVEADAAHHQAQMPPVSMEPNTVAHAKEQAGSQLAMAVAALRRGDDSIKPPNVHSINSQEVESADFFLGYTGNRRLLGSLVRGILSHLAQSDAAQGALQRYRDDIARISVERHQPEQTPASIKSKLAERRAVLMRELSPELRRGAGEYAERRGVEAFIRVLSLPDSTSELLRKHGLIPPEGDGGHL